VRRGTAYAVSIRITAGERLLPCLTMKFTDLSHTNYITVCIVKYL